MIFYNNFPHKSIFVHIPKTGGNTVQRNLLDQNRSLDAEVLRSHQDGRNRFELKGIYTRSKHMTARGYFRYRNLRMMKYIAFVRQPVDRLVSLFFSPHQYFYYNPSLSKYCLPDKIEFDEEKFSSLIKHERSCIDMLNISNRAEKITFPSSLLILRYEKFSEHCKKYLGLSNLPHLNRNPWPTQVSNLIKSKTVMSIVLASHHSADFDMFYA